LSYSPTAHFRIVKKHLSRQGDKYEAIKNPVTHCCLTGFHSRERQRLTFRELSVRVRLGHSGLNTIKLRKSTYAEHRSKETDTGDRAIKVHQGPSRSTGWTWISACMCI